MREAREQSRKIKGLHRDQREAMKEEQGQLQTFE